jgi:hypothetical protein
MKAMEDELRECWQSAAALALGWDELRSARVVAAHEALQHAQQMAKLADDSLRSVRWGNEPFCEQRLARPGHSGLILVFPPLVRSGQASVREDEQSTPSVSSGADMGQNAWPAWRCKVCRPCVRPPWRAHPALRAFRNVARADRSSVP